tara:strand:+ start:196 stop:414 length:219 start_codon:yes stop_codon:yes gene_type:complete
LDSAVPVIVGVESFVVVVEVVNDVGASGEVVSEDELELEVDPSLPETGAFPANVSIGIDSMKTKVDNKDIDL